MGKCLTKFQKSRRAGGAPTISRHEVKQQHQYFQKHVFHDNSNYADDQPLLQKLNVPIEDSKEEVVTLKVHCAYNPVELKTQAVEVPCMISLKAKDIHQERGLVGMDLVCVIDISGSMTGSKIELVVSTLRFMVTVLTPNDRVSLVVFDHNAYRLCPLTRVDEEGIPLLTTAIDKIHVILNNEIEMGLRAGLRVLRDRRYTNEVTAILLLSDGIDSISEVKVNALKAQSEREQISGYAMHTFGYGRDHDAGILHNISKTNDGNFYYVEDDDKIAEAFANCLGELATLVAERPHISISTQPAPLSFSLSKVYSESGDTEFFMPNLLSGSRKDSVFLLRLDPPTDQFGNMVMRPVRVRASFSLKSSGQPIELEAELEITVVGNSENVQIDEEIIVNFNRVKGAEALKEIVELANASRFMEAQERASQAATELERSDAKNSDLIKQIALDIHDAGNRAANQAEWARGGKAQATSLMSNHREQKAAVNTKSYKNRAQEQYSGSAAAYFSKE